MLPPCLFLGTFAEKKANEADLISERTLGISRSAMCAAITCHWVTAYTSIHQVFRMTLLAFLHQDQDLFYRSAGKHNKRSS